MHLSTSYDTGPSGCRWSAVVGQAETQAGSRQWRHRCITKADSRPPGFCAFSISWNAMSVYVFALSVAGFWKPSSASNSGLLAIALVPLLAGHLARPAADAVGDVDQRRPDRARGAASVMCVPSVIRIFARPGDRP